jgi:hypothetical protein
MSRARDDKTRYGLPPPPDPWAKFPTEIPWDRPLAELNSLWLDIRAEGLTTKYPLRLMAAEQGWQVTLREAVDRLRSKQTGAAPDRVLLVAQGVELRKSRNPEGRYHVLLGEPLELRD